MSEFVFLFRSSEAGAQAAMGTPEQAQRSLQSWMAWIGRLERDGYLKERGQPLERSGRIVSGDTVIDGPYLEAKDMVLGFIIVQAPDIDVATSLAKECPMAIGGGSVEVRPIATLAL